MENTIKIRKGNKNQEPCAVYVSHWHRSFDYWVCEVLNTGDTVFSKTTDLIDFDYNKLQTMYYEWKIKNQDVIKKRFAKLLQEHLTLNPQQK